MRKLNKKQSITCHQPIDCGNIKGDLFLRPNTKYTLIIDYPLETPLTTTLVVGKFGMGTNELIGKICKVYQKMYEREDESGHSIYGIRNHDIGDLSLSGIDVDHTKKTIELWVDS